MRRLVILVVLWGGMQLLLPLGEARHGGQRLLIFGFLILAAHTIGQFAVELRLPKLVGYLLTGVVFGPSALEIVSPDSVERLEVLSKAAIAMIAFLAGAELQWDELRSRAMMLTRIVVAESLLTFVVIAAFMLLVADSVPFLQGRPGPAVVAFALLFASIVIVHSPAVTMGILAETRATGPVARTTLGVVLTSDIVVVLAFSCTLSLARILTPPSVQESMAPTLAAVLWQVVGAVIVGAGLGGAVSLYVRRVRRELFLASVIIALAGIALADLARVEALLMMITAGFVSENLSRGEKGTTIRESMERTSAPLFIVFFALAGAQIAVGELVQMGALVAPIVLLRMLSIWAGTRVGTAWARSGPEGRKIWLGLVSQAGVAIGLASVVASAYPVRGEQVRTLFLAIIAINEIVGAVMFRYALTSSGEVSSA